MIYKNNKQIEKIYHGTTPIQVLTKNGKRLFGDFLATLNYAFLIQKAWENAINGKNILFNKGTKINEIDGNSVVMNQLIQNGNFADTSGWLYTGSTFSVSNNEAIYTLIPNAPIHQFYLPLSGVSGHKYLILSTIKASQNISSKYYWGSEFDTNNITTSYKIFAQVVTYSNGGNINFLRINTQTEAIVINLKNCMLFDLTQMFPNNTPTTTDDQRVQWLLSLGYIAYNTGSIVNSKPTKAISHGFNLWDEETKLGYYSSLNGAYIEQNDQLCSANPIRVMPNTTYYIKKGGITDLRFYDKDMNYIGGNQQGSNSTFTTPSNAYFLHINLRDNYGTTYNNDICINFSNATLNGTYKPYVAPIEYTLTMPILRSAGSVQDNDKKVNVGYANLDLLEWRYSSPYYKTSSLQSLVKIPSEITDVPNIISNTYTTTARNNIINDKDMCIDINNGDILIRDSSQSGTPTGTLNYELATPTDQSSITFPDIQIEEGGSIEFQYDNSDYTPSDVVLEFKIDKA